MKPLAIVVAALLLLSAVWAGTDASSAPLAYFNAGENKPHTPGPKATKPTKEKGNPHGKKVTASGVVTAVGDASLTVETKSGETLTFLVTGETTVKIPTLGKDATLADINVGVHALVRASQGEDGSRPPCRFPLRRANRSKNTTWGTWWRMSRA